MKLYFNQPAKWFCMVMALLFVIGLKAQEADNEFTIGAKLNSRGELRIGGFKADSLDNNRMANFILGSYQLDFDYKRSWLELRLSPKQAGVWGQAVGGLSLAEAWALVKSENDTGNTYYSDGIQPHKSMQTFWYHYDTPKSLFGASLLLMNVGMQSTDIEHPDTYYQQLLGTYLTFTPKQWKLTGSFYYQMGKQEDGVPIRAFMGSTKAVYSPGIYSLYAGYDYLSGDKFFALPPNGAIGMALHDTIRGFNAIYGSHHDFYGAMDFFYLDSFVGNFTPGLQTLYVGSNINPIKKLNVDLSYHYYAITTNLERIPSKTLGHDLEIKASYAFSDDIRLSAGYSFLIGTDTMATLQQLDERRRMSWGWLMLSITPKLYTTTWQDKK